MLADALEHLVRGIVSHPDDVTVRDKDLRRGRMLEVRVNPEDIGKVIGRSGRTATALRTVIGALAGRDEVRVDFVDVDKQPRRGPSGRSGQQPALTSSRRQRSTASTRILGRGGSSLVTEPARMTEHDRGRGRRDRPGPRRTR